MKWFKLAKRFNDEIALLKAAQEVTTQADVISLRERIKRLECEDHKWEYGCGSGIDSLMYLGREYRKTCKLCGKVVEMEHEHWLQEQADMHYKKHCGFIEQINQMEEE